MSILKWFNGSSMTTCKECIKLSEAIEKVDGKELIKLADKIKYNYGLHKLAKRFRRQFLFIGLPAAILYYVLYDMYGINEVRGILWFILIGSSALSWAGDIILWRLHKK